MHAPCGKPDPSGSTAVVIETFIQTAMATDAGHARTRLMDRPEANPGPKKRCAYSHEGASD